MSEQWGVRVVTRHRALTAPDQFASLIEATLWLAAAEDAADAVELFDDAGEMVLLSELEPGDELQIWPLPTHA
jgi:hypothetical protein